MLNEMRFGRLSQMSIAAFKALARPLEYDDGIEPTVLFPRREDVDRANTTKLQALNGDGWSYGSVDGGAVTDPTQRAKLLANFMAPETLFLKTHAQVMLIKNLDETLVNGSMGKVMGFEYRDTYVVGRYDEWLENGIPEEIEGDEADNKRIQRTLAIQKLRSGGQKPNPVVRFKVPGGNGNMTRDLLVEADSFKAELPNGEVQASRLQVRFTVSFLT
jgi:ATP-dependent DNA helicase PIF1